MGEAAASLQFIDRLAMEADRGCALVAHAAFDRSMGWLLKQSLRKSGSVQENKQEVEKLVTFLVDKDPLPPLGNFGIRNCACYVLGLINETNYRQFKAFTSVLRNPFAHTFEPVGLTIDDVRWITNPDKWSQRIHILHAEVCQKSRVCIGRADATEHSEARLMFMTACVALLHAIDFARLKLSLAETLPDDVAFDPDPRIKDHDEWQLPPPKQWPR